MVSFTDKDSLSFNKTYTYTQTILLLTFQENGQRKAYEAKMEAKRLQKEAELQKKNEGKHLILFYIFCFAFFILYTIIVIAI
jgi:hypothetical protein